jgi:putative colanic acid biosynthesis glycosyltransferase
MPADSSPLISVIVVCKDPGLRLRDALVSVWAQHISPPPELIVIDGESNDGSRVWLASQRARLATLVMEPDQGVYDAMNKGLAAAHGEWVFFLGADDRFPHDAVLNRAQTVLKQSTSGIAVGEIAYEDGRIYALPAKPKPIERNFVHHQGAFYRRTLFAEHGNFDASLAVMGDYDFNLRLWKKKVTFTALPLRTTVCGAHGLSDSGEWRGYGEEITVRHRHFSALCCWLWDLGAVVRFIRKKFTRGSVSRNRQLPSK